MAWWIDNVWYGKSPLAYLLLPFSFLYRLACWFKKNLTRKDNHSELPPIIVVGNITVGGTGKTPLVIAIAQRFIDNGYSVGIVSRGYKAQCQKFPHEVAKDDRASYVGDESLLMAQRLDCPVVIAPERMKAVQYLVENHYVDLIISDDGLQHYAMPRQLEIVVIDGDRELGNGFCLPAGPLREAPKRLKQVDMMVYNGKSKEGAFRMDLKAGEMTSLTPDSSSKSINDFKEIVAIAAIGHPERFFHTLTTLNIEFTPKSYPDHHHYQAKDLEFSTEAALIMTEKDAVKCRELANERMFYLPICAQLSDDFWQTLTTHPNLKGLS